MLPAGADDYTNATSCIHRWAYRLARAAGPNREIAEAVEGGCTDAIDRWATMFPDEEQRIREDFHALALFHVVQARAGDCDY
jgi:hypothetical protein